MLEIIQDTSKWAERQEKIFQALVVQVNGSSMRKEGATIAVTGSGMISGSVSAGCMEASVIDEAMKGLKTGKGKFMAFCEKPDDLFEPVSPCNGDVFIVTGPLSPEVIRFAEKEILHERNLLRIVLLNGPMDKTGHILLYSPETGQSAGSIIPEKDDFFITAAAKGIRGRTVLENGCEIFIDKITPPPRLVITGASHIASALTVIAKASGFHTVVIDPRKIFAKKERFPAADAVIPKWPGKAFSEITISTNTAVAAISHDMKIDDPALKIAVKSRAFYVGALGSRGTHKARVKRLLDSGIKKDEIDRIHAPIGLEIGSRTPEEIALSIMAEIISVYRTPDHSE